MPYLPQTAQGTHPDTGNPYLITSYTYTTQTVDECQKWEAAKAMSNMSGKDGPPATFTPSRNSKFIHERMMTTGQPPEGMRQRLDPQHGSLTTIGTAQLSSAQLSMIDFHKNPTWISFEDSNLNYGDGFAPYIRENPIATEGVESREFKVKLDFRDSIGKTPISSDHVLVQITGVTGHKPLPPDMTPRAEVITTFSDIRGDHSDFDENPKRTFDVAQGGLPFLGRGGKNPQSETITFQVPSAASPYRGLRFGPGTELTVSRGDGTEIDTFERGKRGGQTLGVHLVAKLPDCLSSKG